MSGDGTERYEQDPLLAVLESYALDVLGELSAEEVEEAACAVEELLDDGEDWRVAVRRRMRWTPLVDASIAEQWHRFRAAARAAAPGGDEPDPAEFARRFADEVTRLSRS